jgi:two-component system NarL family sensor kinase
MGGVTLKLGRLRRLVASLPAAIRRGISRGAPLQVTADAYRGLSWRATTVWLGLLIPAAVITLLLGAARPAPLWVAAVIFASVALSEMFPVKVGRIRYVGSDFGVWLAIAVLGPWPAMLLAVGGVTLDATLRGVPRMMAIQNVSVFAFVTAVGCAVFAGLQEAGATVPGEAGLPLVVLAVAYATDSLNLAVLAVASPMMTGMRVRDAFVEHWMPVLPWMTLTAGLAAGAVHGYHTIGPGALVAAIVVHGGAQVLLKTIEREERQRADVHAAFAARDSHLADALAAEARERRRVALELHDDALQNLLVARQELAVADVARADERLAVAIEAMRALVTRQYQVEGGPTGLRDRLHEMVDLTTSQRGLAFTLDVEVEPAGPAADLLVSLARELVVNATKHSGGTRVSVGVAEDGEFLLLTVADDGAGFDLGSATGRLRAGRLGLTVVQDRLTAQGGDLRVEPACGGGACVRARIPRMESAGA